MKRRYPEHVHKAGGENGMSEEVQTLLWMHLVDARAKRYYPLMFHARKRIKSVSEDRRTE